MKEFNLYLLNRLGFVLTTYKKDDQMTFVLPVDTVFEVVKGVHGRVIGHHYNQVENIFITKIELMVPLNLPIEDYREKIIENEWKVIFEIADRLLLDDK